MVNLNPVHHPVATAPFSLVNGMLAQTQLPIYTQPLQALVARHANVFDPAFTISLFHTELERTGSWESAVAAVDLAGLEMRVWRNSRSQLRFT